MMILCGMKVTELLVRQRGYYYPAHTLWGAENIYVRRHVKVDNKDVLKNHKVYARYVCDDRIKLFVMGNFC